MTRCIRLTTLFTCLALGAPAVAARNGQESASRSGDFKKLDIDQRNLAHQATTDSERQAWDKVSSESDLKKRNQAAEEYLKEYPEGAFAAFAHEIVAVHAGQNNDTEKFFEHGEKAVAGLPNAVALMSSLSAAYAEAQNPNPAIRHGEAALAMLPTMIAPPEYDPSSWPVRRDDMMVDAYYGAGTAYLFKAFGGESQYTGKAVEYLTKATEIRPRDERSHLRLAFAYEVLMKDLEKAVLEYARSAAAEGPNSRTARQYLEQAYQKLHGNTRGVDKLISDQKKILGS